MVESTGLLSRRTLHRVPRVRIPAPPPHSSTGAAPGAWLRAEPSVEPWLYDGGVSSIDTAVEARRVQSAILRRMAPAERVEAAAAMSEDAREIARAGIRFRQPSWTESRVRYQLLCQLYGAHLVARAWGPRPRV